MTIGLSGALYKSLEFVGYGAKSRTDGHVRISEMAIEGPVPRTDFPVDEITEAYLKGPQPAPVERKYFRIYFNLEHINYFFEDSLRQPHGDIQLKRVDQVGEHIYIGHKKNLTEELMWKRDENRGTSQTVIPAKLRRLGTD